MSMMHGLFNVLLNLILKYFIDDFCVYVHKEIGSMLLFFLLCPCLFLVSA
jgi:hypothetical protein